MRFIISILLAFVLAAGALGCNHGRNEQPPAREAGFAETSDGARIYYEKIGGGPAIVFLHGLGGNHAVWHRQAPFFARNHTVVLIAQRGFAPSLPTGKAYDTDVLADDVAAVLDALAIDSADVVGQSMGGWTALALALSVPERVRNLVLADTVGGIFDEQIAAHYAATVDRARDLGRTTPPLGQHPALDADFSRRHPADAYLYQLFATFGSPPPGDVAEKLGRNVFDLDRVRALTVPTLFIVGERDVIFPVDIVRRAAGHVANAEVTVIEDSGHSPYFEQPDRWNQVLARFLAAHEHRQMP